MQVVVGRVIRPHGLRGEVVVDVRTDEPDQRYAVGSVFSTDPAASGPLTVEALRPHQGRLLITFAGFADRDGAEALRGVLLCVDSDSVPEPEDPDEFHDRQLIGLRAESPAGEPIGEVVAIEHAPASDLLVVRRPDGRDALVPFVRAIVPEVDVRRGRVVVTPPGGLFDL
jgi:16S rRNA processing protein RimM